MTFFDPSMMNSNFTNESGHLSQTSDDRRSHRRRRRRRQPRSRADGVRTRSLGSELLAWGAALDSLLGAYRAKLEGHFDTRIFLSGFYTNFLLAAGLTFLGDRLGIDLYLVALFAFGWRIFQNVAVIRRHFL